MKKTELVTAISDLVNTTKAETEKFLQALRDVVSEQLKKGEPIALQGVGTLSVDTRDARTGRHPQTGATITIPAKRVVKFKVASFLKDTVQEESTN